MKKLDICFVMINLYFIIRLFSVDFLFVCGTVSRKWGFVGFGISMFGDRRRGCWGVCFWCFCGVKREEFIVITVIVISLCAMIGIVISWLFEKYAKFEFDSCDFEEIRTAWPLLKIWNQSDLFLLYLVCFNTSGCLEVVNFYNFVLFLSYYCHFLYFVLSANDDYLFH